MRGIGKIAEENDLLILSDEVVSSETRALDEHLLSAASRRLQYDCLTFGKEHVRIASLDDFWKRTVTIGSAVRIRT